MHDFLKTTGARWRATDQRPDASSRARRSIAEARAISGAMRARELRVAQPAGAGRGGAVSSSACSVRRGLPCRGLRRRPHIARKRSTTSTAPPAAVHRRGRRARFPASRHRAGHGTVLVRAGGTEMAIGGGRSARPARLRRVMSRTAGGEGGKGGDRGGAGAAWRGRPCRGLPVSPRRCEAYKDVRDVVDVVIDSGSADTRGASEAIGDQRAERMAW